MSGARPTSPVGFNPELQGLRALAVLLVVLYHAGVPYISSGFVGVDVFFVLSGFLITRILQHELSDRGRLDVIDFYARRLRRLLPALLLMCGVVGILAWLVMPEFEAGQMLASGPAAVTWLSNLYFAYRQQGYFDELANQDLFLHTWSLGVEEQFYLLWPWLLLVSYMLIRRHGLDVAQSRRRLAQVLMIIAVFSFSLCLYWTVFRPAAAFYLMPSRVWQFTLGALAWVWLGGRRDPFGSERLGVTFGVILIVGSAIWMPEDAVWPGPGALLPSLGAALVVISAGADSSDRRGLLAHPMLVWLGDRSYSIYLWHWPWLLLPVALTGPATGWSMVFILAGILLSAAVSYRWVELPFWKGRYRDWSTSRVYVHGFGSMALLAVMSWIALGQLTTTEPRWLGAEVAGKVPDIYAAGCDGWFNNDDVVACGFGDSRAPHTAVLIGDSIGTQWYPAIGEIFAQSGWRVLVFTKSACPIVNRPIYYERIQKTYEMCGRWRDKLLVELDQLRPAVTIIGSSATYEFEPDQWLEGSAEIFARLSVNSQQVLVIPGTPPFDAGSRACLRRASDEEAVSVIRARCRFGAADQPSVAVTSYLESASARWDNVQLLDLNDLICPDGYCYPLNESGVRVYRDSQHLDIAFVRAQVGAVRQKVGQRLRLAGWALNRSPAHPEP